MRTGTLRRSLSRWIDPAEAFAALHHADDYAFWLDAGVDAVEGRSFIGSGDPLVIDGPVLPYLRARLPALHREPDPDGIPLGFVGALRYELRSETTGLPLTRVGGDPDATMLVVDRIIVFDHKRRLVEIIVSGDNWTAELSGWCDGVVATLVATAGTATEDQPGAERPSARREVAAPRAATARWLDTDDEYLAKIAACQSAIHDGEAYQLCLTTEVTVDGERDPLETYLALRATSPTHHGGYLRLGGTSLLSASPETFLSVGTDRVVESRPIKGTRPRGATPAEDRRLRAELLASEKERAENLMIVDLVRNDLGRVCAPGTVQVPSLMVVEEYAQVYQLVSRVRGRLEVSRHPLDAVEACFPAGSMTGAPKLRATELLDELEARPRGLYAGAFGWFGLDGSVELAMTIRSIVLDGHGTTVGAGGGITALSVPVEELAEVKLKARVLLEVLGVGVELASTESPGTLENPAVHPAAGRALPRP